MNILEQFGLNSDDFASVVENPEWFENTGRTTTRLIAGKEVTYNVTIAGKKIPAYVTLQSAKLTRLSLLEQQTRDGRDYWLATGVFKPVQMNIDLLIDGNRMNIIDLLHTIVKQASGQQDHPREQFIRDLRNMGMNFTDGMPMFFQQFGADFNKFKDAIEAFKSAGAVDAIGNMTNPGRIRAAYAHDAGVDVTAFELGTVDRSKSTRNQGFTDLGDAIFEQFLRVVKFTKEANLIKNEIEKNTSSWSQKQIKEAQEQADKFEKMSKQYTSNWAGSQRRIVQLPNGKLETKDQFDPVNAPCGRFTMVVDSKPVEVDLWSNSARANTTTVSSGVTSILDGKTGF